MDITRSSLDTATAIPAPEIPFGVRRQHQHQRVLRTTARGTTRSFASRHDILVAIRLWADRYGEPPTTVDWDPSRARRYGQAWRAERFESGEWPTVRMVRAQFSTFNAAIERAGLSPRRAPNRLASHISGPDAVL